MEPGTSETPSKRERRETLAGLERERAARERRWMLITWGSLATALVLIVGSISYSLWRESQDNVSPDTGGVKSFEVEADHVVKPVSYEESPPVGGPHNPIWLNCGAYDKEVPNENAVHSMEHGAVWLTYDPALSDSDVKKLQDKLPPDYAILSPFPGLEDPVVASAWGRQLRASGVDDSRLDDFLSEFVQGAQAPEPGASCSGGSDGTLPLDAAENG